MKIDAKILAIVVLVLGAVVVGAYQMGVSQSQKESSAQAPASDTAAPTAAAPAGSGPATTGAGSMPANHPPAADPNAPSFTHFRVGNRNVKGMVAVKDAVWVGTSGGAIRYDLKADDYKLYDVNNGSLLSNGVFHVSKVREDIVVGTYGGGMSIFNTKEQKWKNYNIPDGLADQFVYDIDEDPQGNYWIATWSGVNFVPKGNLSDKKGWKTYTVKNTNGGLPNDWVYGVEVGLNGNVWFATEGGLALIDSNGKWTNWQHKDGLGAPYEKIKDDITFKNDPAAASKHHAQQKTEQGLGQDIQVGFNPNYIVSMVVDKDGSVWCGTWGGGLSHFDGKKWTTYSTKEGLAGNHVFMLNMGRDGKLWIGTNKGLSRFKEGGPGFVNYTKAQGLYADNVFSMAEADDGSLWVGSYGGVARIKNYNKL